MNTLRLKHKLATELKAVALTTIFFALWLGVAILLKQLILAEYKIHFHGFSMVVIGSLLIAKVVLVMEHVALGAWARSRPAILDVVVRAVLLYALGVLIALLLEKAFESRHEHGGITRSLARVLHHPEIHHVWVETICVGGALLVFNALSILRRSLGARVLVGFFLSPPPVEPGAASPDGRGDHRQP